MTGPDQPSDVPARQHGLVLAAALVIILAALKAASTVVVPIILAGFITIILDYAARLLNRVGISYMVAFVAVMGLISIVAIVITLWVGNALRGFLEELPTLTEKLNEREKEILDQLTSFGVQLPKNALMVSADAVSWSQELDRFLKGLVALFSNGLVIMLIVVFMLAEAAQFPKKIQAAFPQSGRAVENASEIVENVRRYVAIKTVMSAVTGAFVMTALVAFGVRYAVLWGFLAFILNYIPTLGSLIAAVPAVLVAFLENSVGTAIGVAVTYLVINQVLGGLIEPRLQGKGLGLSTLVVFISLLFWGWMFGPAGVFLSAPLTMIVRIACQDDERVRPISIFLRSY